MTRHLKVSISILLCFLLIFGQLLSAFSIVSDRAVDENGASGVGASVSQSVYSSPESGDADAGEKTTVNSTPVPTVPEDIVFLNAVSPTPVKTQAVRGMLLLPSPEKAPPGGISVDLYASNSTSNNHINILIPEGSSSIEYSIAVPAGSGYVVRYQTTNSNYVSPMYYASTGMVRSSNSALALDLTAEDKTSVDLVVTPKKVVEGRIELQDGVAPSAGIKFRINAVCGSDNINADVVMAAGSSYAAYSLKLPPNPAGSGYKISYSIPDGIYLPAGYYSLNGTVRAEALASPVDVSNEGKSGIDFTVYKKKTISGTILLPEGKTAPPGGFSVSLNAAYGNDSADSTVIIPEGSASADYVLYVPEGEAYKVRYKLTNIAYIEIGYYNQNGTVTDVNTATSVNVITGDKAGISIELIAKKTISGTVSLSSGVLAPVGGIDVTVTASSSVNNKNGKTDVTIPEGYSSAPYTVYVPSGSGYSVSYQTKNASYVETGYYNSVKTVMDIGSATLLDVSGRNESGISLALIEKRIISGRISMPSGEAPSGGIGIKISVSSLGSSWNFTIPEGESSVDYSLLVPPGVNYTIKYEVAGGNMHYINTIYYSTGGAVYNQNFASNITTTGGNQPGINIVLLEKRKVSGTISLPQGMSASQDITFEYSEDNQFAATIHKGESSAPYTVYFDPGVHIVYYGVSEDSIFVQNGYYSTGGTVTDKNAATPVDVTAGDQAGINLVLILKKTISGSVLIPPDVSTNNNIVVTVNAGTKSGSTITVKGTSTILIPKGQRSADYMLFVPAGDGYKVWYTISTPDSFASPMYFNFDSMTVNIDSGSAIDVSKENKADIDLTLIEKKTVSGAVLLPSTIAPKGGIKLNVNIENSFDTSIKPTAIPLTIPEGASSISYTASLLPAAGYKVRYTVDSNSDYATDGYYGAGGITTLNANSAAYLDLSNGNKTDINLNLIKKRIISGTMSLPSGGTTSSSISVSIYAGSSSYSTSVTIPANGSSAQYAVKVPPNAAGSGYKVYYSLSNSTFISPGYYSSVGMTADQSSAELVDVSGSDREGINLVLIPKSSISGNVSINSNAPTGGIKVTVSAANSKNSGSVDVTIPEGKSTIPYNIYVPSGTGYTVKYQTSNVLYVKTAYYSAGSTVRDLSQSTQIDLGNENKKGIDLTLIENKKIEGTVSLPGNRTSPANGLKVTLRAFNGVDDIKTDITIPQGYKSIQYTLYVPAAEDYKISYSVSDAGYMSLGYYNSTETTLDIDNATVKNISSDVRGIDFVLIAKMAISGEILLPTGTAPAGGIRVTVTATQLANTKNNASIDITVPEGFRSIPYTLYVPTGSGYEVKYQVGNNSFIATGYYNVSGTKPDEASATLINAYGDCTGIDLTLIAKKTISGTVLLPDVYAPIGGIKVTVSASNGKDTVSLNLTIPEASKSIAYTLFIPPGQDYVVKYSTNVDAYINTGYYSKNGTKKDIAGTEKLDATSASYVGINLTLIAKNIISGRVSLPVGTAPYEGISLTISASNGVDNGKTDIIISQDSSSASYVLYVPAGSDYTVSYTFKKQNEQYLSPGYYGGNETTRDSSGAALVDVSSGSKTGINMIIIPKRLISGVISLPPGLYAPENGLALKLSAKNAKDSAAVNIMIPQGNNSAAYKIYVPDGPGYKIGYTFTSTIDDYSQGYYNENGTVLSEGEATAINVNGENKNGFNIIIIPKKAISGVLTLPADVVVPPSGISVKISADSYSTTVTIPQDKRSVPYILKVPANKPGTGYFVGYRISTANINCITTGYYASNGTVPSTQTATLIDVSSSDRPNTDIQILNKRIISGKVILPSGNAPVGGIALTIEAEGAGASTDAVITAGTSFAEYKLSVSPNSLGSGYRVKYTIKPASEIYTQSGYYSLSGTKPSLSQASLVDVYNGDQTNIDLKLIPKSAISGVVSLPSGNAPEGGVTFDVVASSPTAIGSVRVTIPAGKNSAPYTVNVTPAAGYKVYYSIVPNNTYVTKGYYSEKSSTVSTVPVEKDAASISTINGNILGINLKLILNKVISGNIALPGGYAPAGGIEVGVYAENSALGEPAGVTVIIPAGKSSAKYTLYLPPVSKYKLYYQLDPNQDYVTKGYYSGGTTAVNSGSASEIDLSTADKTDANLTLIRNRFISGMLSIINRTAPAGGIDVKISASSTILGSSVGGSVTVKIPEGSNSVQYRLPVPPGAGYCMWYEVKSGIDYFTKGYYGAGRTELNKNSAVLLDLSSSDRNNINIALINFNSISGTVSLPSGTAPDGGVTLTIYAESTSNIRSAEVVIPKGKSSADYTLYVPDGKGYQVYCTMPLNDIYADKIYYSFSGPVLSKSKATSIDIIQAGRSDINLNLIAKKTINGTVFLPEPAPAGGIEVEVSADNGNKKIVAIPYGSSSAPYSIKVLPNEPGSGYIMKYNTTFDYGYTRYGYYSDSGTVRNIGRAKPVDVSLMGKDEINFVLSRPRTISGSVSIPSGYAPEGGISIDVVAANSVDSTSVSVYIPQGSSSASYTLYVPVNDVNDDYKLRYENWTNNAYVSIGYYGSYNMTRNADAAAGISVRTADVSGINLNLIGKKAISGIVSIPSDVAPDGGLIVTVTAKNSVDSGMTYVTIPGGSGSAPYLIYAPAGSGYKVSYEISIINDYVKKGYYNLLNTVYKPDEATILDLSSEDKKDVNLSLIMKKTISGSISLPDNTVAPSGGIKANIFAEDAGGTLVTIPEGAGSAPYSMRVSPNTEGIGYKVNYDISSSYGFVTSGYYSVNGTVRNSKLANFVYANDNDASGINITVMTPRALKGKVSLPEGTAPKGGITVNITAANETDGNSTTVTIPYGSSSADYSISLPPNDNGYEYVIKYENWSNPVYTLYGYYNPKGTTGIFSQAGTVDISSRDASNINLTLLKRRIVGGVIKVPSGASVPKEGLNVNIIVENTLQYYMSSVIIPYGTASVPYEVYVEDGSGYKLSYSLPSNDSFIEDGYLSNDGTTTTNYNSAKTFNVAGGNQSNMNLTLLLKRKITGTVVLPDGFMSDGGIEVDISAFNGKDIGSVTVLIPEGSVSSDFELSLPAGNGYKLQYEVGSSIELASRGYYGESGTVRDIGRAYPIDLSSGDQNDLRLVLLENRVINGFISLPSGVAPLGGIKIVITATDAAGAEFKKEVVVREGENNVSYALSVPPNSPLTGYKLKYSVALDSYTALGYYSSSGTTLLPDMAEPVDVSSSDVYDVNLILIEKKIISGTLSLPAGSLNSGSLVVNIKASSDLLGTEDVLTVIIPAGINSMPYSIKVEPNVEGAGYKLGYEMLQGEGYVYKGYFNTSGIVPDAGLASPIDVSSGNYTNANLALIKGRIISGKIALPGGALAPAGGVSVGVFALKTNYTGYKIYSYVTIPGGQNSTNYELNVPESAYEVAGLKVEAYTDNGSTDSMDDLKAATNIYVPLMNGPQNSDYEVGYAYMGSDAENTAYSQSGFYSKTASVPNISAADTLNVSGGNKADVNLSLIAKSRKIQGIVSIPGDKTASSGGIKVDIAALNEQLDYTLQTSVVIPQGKSSVSYELRVPSLGGYHVKYSIGSAYGYVLNGFYGTSGTTGEVNVSSQDAQGIDLQLYPGKAISGKISLPAGLIAKDDSLWLWVTASNESCKSSAYINIAKGSSSANYKVYVPGGSSYIVSYSTVSLFGEYVNTGYFNSTATTPNAGAAAGVYLTSDVSNVNLTLLPSDRTISGTVSLPEGTAEVPYLINVPANNQGSGYYVGYTVESGNNKDTYLDNGYYSKEGTAVSRAGSDAIDVSRRNSSNIWLMLLKENIVPLEGLTFSRESITVQAGQNVGLKTKYYPSDATNKALKWYSSNTNIAVVSSEGVVTALTPGMAYIKASGYNSVQAVCTVIVIPSQSAGLSLDKSSLFINPGESEQLRAIFNPDAGIEDVAWSSDNEAIAKVSSDGLVSALSPGRAVITLINTADPSMKAICVVNVSVPAVGIKLDKSNADIQIGSSEQLTASILPDSTTFKDVTWTSSNSNVAIVSQTGVVSAVSLGTAIITARWNYNNVVKASCTVNIKPIPVKEVKLNKTSMEMTVYSSAILTATVLPEEANDRSVRWESSNKDIVTVVDKGSGQCEIKAIGLPSLSPVTVKVTAISNFDPTKRADCEVVVKPVPVTGIVLNKSSEALKVGGTLKLQAAVTPVGAANKNVTWVSSNSSIASLTYTGLECTVTGVKDSTSSVKITASIIDNGIKFSASCSVKVIADDSSDSSSPGGGIVITPTPTPTSTPTSTPTPTPTNRGTGTPTPTPTQKVAVQPSTPVPGGIAADLSEYKDIGNHWAAQYFAALLQKGIINGYPDKTLRPNAEITRAETTKMIISAAGFDLSRDTYLSCKDRNIVPAWAVPYVRTAMDKEIIKGYEDNTFRPNNKLTRKEMAVIVMKAFGYTEAVNGQLGFADSKSIPSWAKGYVARAIEYGIIKGYDDNTFKPDKTITRAEAAAMIARCLDMANKQ